MDVIVTYGTEATAAANDATASIPIVMASAGDPVGTIIVKIRQACPSDKERGKGHGTRGTGQGAGDKSASVARWQ